MNRTQFTGLGLCLDLDNYSVKSYFILLCRVFHDIFFHFSVWDLLLSMEYRQHIIKQINHKFLQISKDLVKKETSFSSLPTSFLATASFDLLLKFF